MIKEQDAPGDIAAAQGQAAAREALVEAYRRVHQDRAEKGYVDSVHENLVDGVSVDMFCDDFAGAGGHELTPRPRAIVRRSSARSTPRRRWR